MLAVGPQRGRTGRLGRVTNDLCWDGRWYLRACKDSGEPLGTHRANQGQIFINAQTWSVLSELAPAERGRQVRVASSPDWRCWPTSMESNSSATRGS